jgi:ubiquinone/menaquinone biosynthesis C-methylase UbiE
VEQPVQAALVALMLHHVEAPGPVLANLFRLLEPGARVVVAEFHPDGPGEKGPPLAKRLGPTRLQALCDQAGFTMTSYWLQSPEHYVFMLRR